MPHGKHVTRRRQDSDMKAYAFLSNFELRTMTNGNMGIFLKGSNSQCGTIYRKAQPFLRALMTVMEASADPSDDRQRQILEGPKGIDPATGKRHIVEKRV